MANQNSLNRKYMIKERLLEHQERNKNGELNYGYMQQTNFFLMSFLMNINFLKMLPDQSQQNIKSMLPHLQVDFILNIRGS